MMTYDELKTEKARKVAELRLMLDVAQSEGRGLTRDEKAKFTKVEGEIDVLASQIESESRRSAGTIIGGAALGQGDEGEPEVRGVGATEVAARQIGAAGRSYRAMFVRDNRELDKGGFPDLENFLKAVHLGLADPRLAKRAMSEGVDSEGGFLLPEEFAGFILDRSMEAEVVRPRATVWPMLSATRKVPGWDNADHSTTLYGGISGQWLGEGGTATETDAKVRLIQLNAKKLACYTAASNELIADGANFEEVLGGALVKATAWFLDYGFLRGTGAGQPLGVLNDVALITATKEVGQGAGTIQYENILKMWARLAPACAETAVWIGNPTIVPQLFSMGISLGVGAAPVFIPAGGLSASPYGTLFGKALLFSEKLPALGSKGDLVLADLTCYSIGVRKEVSLDKSNAPRWLQDQSSYRCIVRVDGMGQWSGPMTPKNGDTLSWCVCLEART